MESVDLTRRSLLASAAIIGLTPKTDPRIIGGFVFESQQWGHRLRDRAAFPVATRQIKVPVIVAGGGIAGLSAAWRLEKKGFHDFLMLEAESGAGGNARWGENEVSAYPWAAHYLPVPNRSAEYVRELCQELGLLQDDGRWDELTLCHSPQERLFLYGRWQEGIEPSVGLQDADRQEFRRFDERMAEFRASKRFMIPMERGEKSSPLDHLSMADWMRQEKFRSRYLNWYVNYCCRDDYGAMAAATSAWAGVHYFAAREHEEKGPLVWPEGNGWIARRLIEKLGRYIRAGAPVHRISKRGRGWSVLAGDTEYLADCVIFAAPTFTAPYIVEGAAPVDFTYSPWLTANLTLRRLPREAPGEPLGEKGMPLCWDNVIFDSPALGYVDNMHQSLRTHIDQDVWTFYWALAMDTPARSRRLLLDNDWNFWKDAILNDLERAHPDIRQCVSRIDILRLGHAMARPTPGFLESADRRRAAEGSGTLFYANSDLSGFSIFEEAQYRGVRAADRAMHTLGRS
jgi:glycine/D-amino acid oxidase-like deaminating enzyme